MRTLYPILLAWIAAACLLGGGLPAHGQVPLLPKTSSADSSADQEKEDAKPSPTEDKRSLTVETLSFLDSLKLGKVWEENDWKTWAILFAAIFLGFLIGRIAAMVLGHSARRIEQRGWKIQAEVVGDLQGPVKLALLGVGLAVGLAGVAGMSAPLIVFWQKTLLLIFSIAVFWYGYNLIGVLDILLGQFAARSDSELAKQLAPLVRKSIRVFLVVIAVLFIFDSVFNQDIGAWLAGLGIASIAVSLAAQDSIKNLFGSITIVLDQPFQVGERINYSGYDGVVEEIGFRSTKVRTLTGHLVTIPNSRIVNDPVENIARRPSIRRSFNITITYDTPREKVEQAVQILRDILDEDGIREPIHATSNGDEYPPRVYFNDLNADSLNIFVMYWYAPPAYWDFMDHGQRLHLRIFEEFEKAGIEFAFPTQTLYLAGDPKRELAVRMLGADLPG